MNKFKLIIAALLLLLFINTAAANSARIVDYKLQILDDSSNIIATHEAEFGVYGLTVYDGIAYATTSGGYIIADVQSGALIGQVEGASAEQVHDIVVNDRWLVMTTEYFVTIYDNSNKYKPKRYNVKWTMNGVVPDLALSGDILYLNDYKYNLRKNPDKCLNPGAFIAMYDNKGTWAVEYPMNGYYMDAEVIGFGWKGTEPVTGDFDGDGFKDVGVYNRAGNNFLIRSIYQGDYKIIGLGWSGVTPVTGDFDGDGDDDVGVFDNKGTWALNTNKGVRIVGFGWSGVTPVTGDWNGDGVDEVGIYNRAGNNFLVPKGTGFQIIGLGWSGVIPIVGNWDSDINDEVGVYDSKTSTFALAGQKPFVFGKAGSQPLVGDIDFNGITEVGVCKPDGSIAYNIAKHYTIELQKWKGATVIGV